MFSVCFFSILFISWQNEPDTEWQQHCCTFVACILVRNSQPCDWTEGWENDWVHWVIILFLFFGGFFFLFTYLSHSFVGPIKSILTFGVWGDSNEMSHIIIDWITNHMHGFYEQFAMKAHFKAFFIPYSITFNIGITERKWYGRNDL